ncbi:hypothetical protein KCP77_21015 [Salmonella enterica subsp. enterica]|nr:hypothetical protein KCP77_21015 [Salmonella enterica subsp. enterica]
MKAPPRSVLFSCVASNFESRKICSIASSNGSPRGRRTHAEGIQPLAAFKVVPSCKLASVSPIQPRQRQACCAPARRRRVRPRVAPLLFACGCTQREAPDLCVVVTSVSVRK